VESEKTQLILNDLKNQNTKISHLKFNSKHATSSQVLNHEDTKLQMVEKIYKLANQATDLNKSRSFVAEDALLNQITDEFTSKKIRVDSDIKEIRKKTQVLLNDGDSSSPANYKKAILNSKRLRNTQEADLSDSMKKTAVKTNNNIHSGVKAKNREFGMDFQSHSQFDRAPTPLTDRYLIKNKVDSDNIYGSADLNITRSKARRTDKIATFDSVMENQ
jgi:hypothetical protein